jgi:putative FmdB family regulatory protein
MPLIEFVCKANHHTEQILSFADSENLDFIVCPMCTGRAWRQIGTPAVVFKGSGFTPKFHTGASEISGVPVHQGDKPEDVAKKVVGNLGGGEKLFKGLTGKK